MLTSWNKIHLQWSVIILILFVSSLALAACSAGGTITAGPAAAPDATRVASPEVQSLLPETYRSEDGRLSFRYPSAWKFESRNPQAVSNKLRLANNPDGLSGKTGQVAVEFVDPAFVMEMAGMTESSVNLSDVLRAYARAALGQQLLQGAGEPEEVTLGDRSATALVIPAGELDLMYVALRGGDSTVYVMKAATSKGELEQFKSTILAMAEASNFIAPVRGDLDGPAQAMQDYLAFVVQTPDLEEALNYMCSRQRANLKLMVEMLKFLLGSTTTFHPDQLNDLTRAYLAFGATQLNTDISHLYYDTISQTDRTAVVNVMGNLLTSSGQNGERRTVPFHQFTGRNQYRLILENGKWLLCES
jgi:hypothetical protein